MLLDTCTLIWLALAPETLSAVARQRLSENARSLFVCAITAFELGVKQQKGKLALPSNAEAWYTRALALHGLDELPVTGMVAARSTQLPRLHADPCDRMIVAAAQLHDITVLTPDPLIGAYPDISVEW